MSGASAYRVDVACLNCGRVNGLTLPFGQPVVQHTAPFGFDDLSGEWVGAQPLKCYHCGCGTLDTAGNAP